MQNAFDPAQKKRFLDAILSAKDERELEDLLEDLCTIKELQDMVQRLEVARLLRRKMTYADIAEQVGVSTATISRVNRALSYGEGGYDLALSRLEEASDD